MKRSVWLGVLVLGAQGCTGGGTADDPGVEPVGPPDQQGDAAPCELVCEHLGELCGTAPLECVRACAEEATPAQRRCLLATTDCGALTKCDDAEGPGADDDGACAGEACDGETACDGVDCDGHGECAIISGSAACFCEDGYQPRASDALTCVEGSDGWGYDFDADSSTERMRAFLDQNVGEWFPERPSWTVGASDYASYGYLFQRDGLTGTATYYVDSLLSLQTTQTYDRRFDPVTIVSKVSPPLAGGPFDGYRALELRLDETEVLTTILVKTERVQSSMVTEHEVLHVASCPTINREGVARPALAKCFEEASSSEYVRSILGARAYDTGTR